MNGPEVIVTQRYVHLLADETSGAVIRAACGGETGAAFTVMRWTDAPRSVPMCPACAKR